MRRILSTLLTNYKSGGIYTIYGMEKKGRTIFDPALKILGLVADYLFLNFLLNAASPIRPEPSRSMVAGSGTGLILETKNIVSL